MDLMPFDELNRLEAAIPDYMNRENKSKADLDSLLDMLEDLFLLAYANGVESANVSLGADISADISDVQDTVDREIAGETWRERVEDYFLNGGTVADIVRVMETEMHRDYNEAALQAARKAGAKTKTWNTQLDPLVREAHEPLQSVTVPINGTFVTWDGYETQAPGMFGVPELDCNCRCYLTFS
jgi:hypothetical protein